MPRVQLRPDNYIMQQFLQALAAASARRSYSMVIAVPDGDPCDEMRRLIASRSVDAFLLSELQPADPRVVMLAKAGRPFACFGRIGPALPQHWVDIDNCEATAAAVEHVLNRGFGRLAFLGYRSGNHWDTERVAGFKAGLSRYGIDVGRADMLLVDDAGGTQEGQVPARSRSPGRPPGRDRDQQRPARRGRLQRGRGTAAADRP
jgi:DNA-binding LacI/PurR family transcriptional regulator